MVSKVYFMVGNYSLFPVLAIYADGWLFVTGRRINTWVVVQAGVLGSGMWAGTSAAAFLPSTLHRAMPPAVAPEALLWPGNVDTDAACDPLNCEI